MATDLHGSRLALEKIPAAIRAYGPDLFLACAQGQGKAERALVTTIGREQRMRELSTAALGEAFDAIPETLRQGVRARLARRAS